MLYLLLMLQASGADLDTSKLAYERCVTAEAVRLGASNQETADTILRAVRSKCDGTWQQLVNSFPSGTGVPMAEAARVRALSKWRSDAEDAGIAALLEARSRR